jgi:N-methylhydantoinase B
MEAIVWEMGEAMLRTSYSQILNSSRDFSTAICDERSRLVAQAEHVPIHVGAIPFAVRAVQDTFKGSIRPGDVYLLNDPYHGNNHLPDLTAFVPVFVDGELRYWSVNRAHQSDIGGATHGSYNPAATEIWQEGIRIPPLRLYDSGLIREDVLHLLSTNVRHARDFRGDLSAMVGSARLGERRLLQLVSELGAPTVRAAIEAGLDATERETRECIATWRDGVYRGEAVIDDDGHGARDVTVRATVTKRGGDLVIDLTESDPQVTGFVNSSYANMRSAVAMGIAFLLDPQTPKNDGTFRPVEVVARQGTVVWAHSPAPVTLCTSHCAQEIAEAIIKALAPACPERAIAGWSRRFRIAIQGEDPRTGRDFIWHLFHARGGGGASAGGDGWSAAGEGHTVGGIKFGSVEVSEVRSPLFFRVHEFRPGSAGEGRHRGGLGSILELVMETERPAIANTAGDGVRHRPYGLLGGREGLPHRYRIRSMDGRYRTLRTKESGILVLPGDVFIIESAGGGGYGDPAERTPERRAVDQENGVSNVPRRRSK